VAALSGLIAASEAVQRQGAASSWQVGYGNFADARLAPTKVAIRLVAAIENLALS
jgi:hypothetical protein